MKTNISYLRTQGLLWVGAFDSFFTGFFAATFFNAFLLGNVAIFASAFFIVISILLMIGHHSAKSAGALASKMRDCDD